MQIEREMQSQKRCEQDENVVFFKPTDFLKKFFSVVQSLKCTVKYPQVITLFHQPCHQ